MKELSAIHIAIAFDKNYQQQFYALLSSILNNVKSRKVHFHLIAPDMSEPEKLRLQEHISDCGNFSVFYSIDQGTIQGLLVSGAWTLAVYYRILFPLIVPERVERLIYLDTDTLILHDLSELYETEMQNFPVAAVYDNYVKKQELIGVEEGNYFNSGVLLIDVPKWRKQKVSEKTLSYLRANPEKIRYVDQCGLNAVLDGNWMKLPFRFNLLYSYVPESTRIDALRDFLSDKVVIHFNLQRPWEFLCKNRYRYLYWFYLGLSPLADRSRIYSDFSVSKIPSWLKLRAVEAYLDHPWIQQIWRGLKPGRR